MNMDPHPNHEDIIRAVGRLEGKVDMLLTAQAVRDGRYLEHNVRLTKVEKKQAWTAGAVAAITTIAGAAAGWFKMGGGGA